MTTRHSRIRYKKPPLQEAICEVHSEIDGASGLDSAAGELRVSESAAWLAVVDEATADSRPMTDEERRAVDDFFLSQFE